MRLAKRCATRNRGANGRGDRGAQKIDIQTDMQRTIKRPIPQGKVSPVQALLFALFICVLGMSILIFLVNPLSAWLTLASFVGYAIIYTGFL